MGSITNLYSMMSKEEIEYHKKARNFSLWSKIVAFLVDGDLLTGSELKLYLFYSLKGMITDHGSDGRESFWKREDIARRLNWSTKHVSIITSSLEQKGLIKVRNDGRKNFVKVNGEAFLLDEESFEEAILQRIEQNNQDKSDKKDNDNQAKTDKKRQSRPKQTDSVSTCNNSDVTYSSPQGLPRGNPKERNLTREKEVPSEPNPLSAKADRDIDSNYGPGEDEFGFPIEEAPKQKSTKHDDNDINTWFKPKQSNFLQEMDWDSLDDPPKKNKQSVAESKPLQSAATQPPVERKLSKKELLQLMDRWNGHAHTPKHKSPDTAVFKQSMKLLNALRAGNINTKESKKALFLLDEDFCDKFDLPKKVPTFNFSQIEKLMDRVASLYDPQYGGDKKYLPKSLADCLYNPRSMNSRFIQCHYDPPKLLKEKVSDRAIAKLEPDVQEAVEAMYSTMGTINRIYPQESPTITRRLAQFYDVVMDLLDHIYEVNKRYPDITKRLEEYLPCTSVMIEKYLAFLKRKNLTELKFLAFYAKVDQDNPLADNYLFQQYLIEQSNGIGVDLIDGGYL